MARISATYVFFLLLVTAARADWTIATSNTEKSAGGKVEHRRIVLDDDETGGRAKLELALFSTKAATLRVIDSPSGHDDLAAAARREGALAGVNGGYFDPENQPVGLMISAGKLIAPLRKARLLSGVMVVSEGQVQLLRTGEYSPNRNVTAALQCGPFLVDRGNAVAGLNATRSDRRTFVAVGASDRVTLGFCSDTTLKTLATILATPTVVPDLKIQRALNLDGGSSSAFWFGGERGTVSISEQKTVRNFVLAIPK